MAMRSLVIGIVLLVVLGLGASSSWAAWMVEVPQGQVGMWPGEGEGDASCGMDGKVWPAIEGTCYYPIDFERSPARIEIARWDGAERKTGWLTVKEVEFPLQEISFPDDSYVHLSEEDLARHYQEQAKIKPLLRKEGGPAKFTLPLGKPLAQMVDGEFFGVPRSFNGEPKGAHTGADYAVGMGTPVRAVADGTVLLAGEQFFAGRCVYVQHGGGLISMYFHLSETAVADGETVTREGKVAEVGSTGRSTGPHLHVGLRWHGARIDPEPLYNDPSGLPAVTEQ